VRNIFILIIFLPIITGCVGGGGSFGYQDRNYGVQVRGHPVGPPYVHGQLPGFGPVQGHSPRELVRPRSVWCDERGRCLEVRPKYRNVPSYRNDRLYRVW